MEQVSSVEAYAALKKRASNVLGLVVHFSADWCEPCKTVNAHLTKLAETFKDQVIFAEVDGAAHADICEGEDVTSVPFIAFFRTRASDKEQEHIADVVGAKLDQIDMNTFSLYGEAGHRRKDFDTLDAYLTYLTSRPGVVMFITGSPSRPRCGFTGRLCEVMGSLNAPFIYYDVMADDEVCERLKVFSNWPTYPQVYVDGELIGGWDICKELHESNELKSTLKLE